MIRRHGTQTIIIPGSVGLPFATYGYTGELDVLTMPPLPSSQQRHPR
jgi:hypothetical protein